MYQSPGTDICITFKSPLMRGRFMLIILLFAIFQADSVFLNIKSITPKIQNQWPWNLVEMCNTKSSSSHKKLSFTGLLDCYQISHLSRLLYAKNCCTIVDKFHSKTEYPLSNSHEILHNHHNISVDYAYQISVQYYKIWTLKHGCHYSLHRFPIFGQISTFELLFFELNQTWSKLE